MNKTGKPMWYILGFGCAGSILGPIVAVALGWIWMEHYTRTTGYDAGNAPPFFFALGLIAGTALGALAGKLFQMAKRP